MTSELLFKGKKVTDRDRKMLEEIFDEPIHDMYLCQSILLAAMKPENLLARAAFTRALTKKKCAYHEGVRDAKRVIRETRRKLGYRVTLHERMARTGRGMTRLGRRYRERRGEIWHAVGDTLVSVAKFLTDE